MARAKTQLVAIYPRPDGRVVEFTIYRKQGAWWWDHGKGSHPLSAAIENVKAAGGTVERRPIQSRQSLARRLNDFFTL